MLQLMHWAQSIFLLQGLTGAEYIVDVHWIFKAHLVLGLTIFLLFPFTRLVHVLSVPVKYLDRNYQVVRRRIGIDAEAGGKSIRLSPGICRT